MARKNDRGVINKFLARRFNKLSGKAVVPVVNSPQKKNSKKCPVYGVVNKVSRRVSKLEQKNNTLKKRKSGVSKIRREGGFGREVCW